MLFRNPAMLQAVLLGLSVCFQLAKQEEADELPSTAVPKLSGENYTHEVDEGGVFKLKCQYEDLGSKATVMWRKDQYYITLGEMVMDTGDQRVSVAPSDQSMQVVNASRKDAGLYTCLLGINTGSEKKLEQYHWLNVKYPAKITKVEPMNGVSTHAGMDVMLRCDSEGFPAPLITWMLKDKPVEHAEMKEGGRVLHIPNIKPQHAGLYKCVSDNGVGSSDEQGINVSVLFPPKVVAEPAEPLIAVLLHDPVTLRCRVVEAYPKPTIKWLFNETQMPSKTTEELTIEKMTLDNAGVYKCEVGNRIGEIFESSFTLSVIYPPQVKVMNPWMHTGIGKTTELLCIVDAQPPATVTWLHNSTQVANQGNKKMMVDNTNYKLLIRDFTQNDFGTYTCMAQNALSSAYEVIILSGLATPVGIQIIKSSESEISLRLETRSYSPVTEFALQYRKVTASTESQEMVDLAASNWTTITIPAEHSDLIYSQIYFLAELEMDATYEVMLRAHNDYGWNEPSNVFRFSVTEDGVSESVQVPPSVTVSPPPPTINYVLTKDLLSSGSSTDSELKINKEHQSEPESEPSKGRTNSQFQLALLLTAIATFSRVFW